MNKDKLIYPEPISIGADEAESWENWGFRDTSFTINDRDVVEITGSRYELSGKELPRLLPWIRETLGIELDARDQHKNAYPTGIPQPVESPVFSKAIREFLNENQIDTDGENRLRHGHGHTQDEMFAIKHKRLGRIPDMVVYPEREEQVAALITEAKGHDVLLIPFRAATNVTPPLLCHPD